MSFLDEGDKDEDATRVIRARGCLKEAKLWFGHRGWEVLPKSERGRRILRWAADQAYLASPDNPKRSVRRWCRRWAPWLTPAELGFPRNARQGRKCRLFAHSISSPDSQPADLGAHIAECLQPCPRIFPFCGDYRRRPSSITTAARPYQKFEVPLRSRFLFERGGIAKAPKIRSITRECPRILGSCDIISIKVENSPQRRIFPSKESNLPLLYSGYGSRFLMLKLFRLDKKAPLTRLHLIREGEQPVIDVVFMHGLDGDAYGTWGFNSEPSWST
jgi:hypothetical protein